MGRNDRDMVDVELVDGATGAGGPTAGADLPGDPALRRRLWRRAAVVVGVALAGLATSTQWGSVEAARDDARVAAFSDVEGFASSLREPLAQRWSTTGFVSAAGGLVLSHQESDATRRTEARDVRTGELRWTVPAPATRDAWLMCSASTSDRALLLCDVQGVDGQTAPNTDAVLGGEPDRLVVLDASDGSRRAERVLDARTVGWAFLDDDVVVARHEDGVVRVERTTLVAAEPLWSVDVPLPVAGLTADSFGLAVEDGLVVVTGPVAGVLDGDDGTVLGVWSVPEGSRRPVQVQASAEGVAVWTDPDEGTWFDRGGAAGARLPGAPVRQALGDGSEPHVVLVEDAEVLRAVDVRAGEEVWRSTPVEQVLLRVDGLAVLQRAGSLQTVDVLTGEVLWFVGLDGGVPRTLRPVTDGVRLLVPSALSESSGRPEQVTAYDLRTGERRWTLAVPGSDGAVEVIGTGTRTVAVLGASVLRVLTAAG